MSIRKAVPKDIARIAEIEVFNYRQNFYPIFRNDEFYFAELTVTGLMAKYESRLDSLYVYDDGVVKGFMAVEREQLKKLFVEPVLQRNGVGSALITYACEVLGARFLWVLEKNTGAISLYGRHGFEFTGECIPEEDTGEFLLGMSLQKSETAKKDETENDVEEYVSVPNSEAEVGLGKYAVLKTYFGHTTFRSGQEQVVDAILAGNDTICVMPTGAGKSVCYQVPAVMFEGITLVVSPLISLMKDQVNALNQNGIRAAYLNSSLSAAQCEKVMENIRNGVYKLVYVAPERLMVTDFLRLLEGVNISLLAIDEAHCISQWGQDFRPSYLKIAEFVELIGYRPIIAAFTATATEEVKNDIEYSLRMKTPFRITTGFDRPNLKFVVRRPKNKMAALLDILKEHSDESGIVYRAGKERVHHSRGGAACER